MRKRRRWREGGRERLKGLWDLNQMDLALQSLQNLACVCVCAYVSPSGGRALSLSCARSLSITEPDVCLCVSDVCANSSFSPSFSPSARASSLRINLYHINPPATNTRTRGSRTTCPHPPSSPPPLQSLGPARGTRWPLHSPSEVDP